MSVVIPGMEMPKNCWECPCFVSDGWFCNLDDEYRDVCDGRPDWCPLVELPKKHGRLFDSNEVKKVLDDLPDSEDKWSAIALLEWAIEKRWCIEAEGDS